MIDIPIERWSLRNGLRIIFSADRTRPVVAVNLWYNVGSRNERPGRTGFAHLFEHMMFQGSEHVEGTGHISHVERVGGAVNGSTWLDRTNYYQTLPSEHLDLALWLESDRMGFLLPAMTEEKLDNQRDVVKNERRWRVDNQPYGDWDERMQALLFPQDHPYHHSVIGSMADLDAADLDDVREFFRTYYIPNNAVLSICGDFDPVAAREAVETYFGEIPAGPPIPPLPGRPDVPPFLGAPADEIVQSRVAVARVYLGFRIPIYGTDDFYTGDVAAHLLAGGKASRLYRDLVRERRLAQDVTAFAFPVVTGAALLVLWATAAPGVDPDDLRREIWTHLDALAESSPSKGETARASIAVETQQTVGMQQVATRADLLSMFTTLFDEPERIRTELERYRAVSPDAVRAFTAEFLRGDRAASLTYLPDARGAV